MKIKTSLEEFIHIERILNEQFKGKIIDNLSFDMTLNNIIFEDIKDNFKIDDNLLKNKLLFEVKKINSNINFFPCNTNFENFIEYIKENTRYDLIFTNVGKCRDERILTYLKENNYNYIY